MQPIFPTLKTGKFAVWFSGGVESTLLASMAIDTYGYDNVLAIWSDDMFCEADTEVRKYIKQNILNTASVLGITPVFVDIDYELFKVNPKQTLDDVGKRIVPLYNIEYQAAGFTKTWWEVEHFQQLSPSQVVDVCNSDRAKFANIIKQFYIDQGIYNYILEHRDEPVSWDEVRNADTFVLPFGDMYKQDVIDLYFELGKQELLYKTTSCVSKITYETGKHCGVCWQCQNRHDSFGKHIDPTVYDSDKIKLIREQHA